MCSFVGNLSANNNTKISNTIKQPNYSLVEARGIIKATNGNGLVIGGFLNDNWYNGCYLSSEGLFLYYSDSQKSATYNILVFYTKS